MEFIEGLTTIFQSGDKFCLWERMCDGVAEITSRDIRDIVLVVAQSGLKELCMEEVSLVHHDLHT